MYLESSTSGVICGARWGWPAYIRHCPRQLTYLRAVPPRHRICFGFHSRSHTQPPSWSRAHLIPSTVVHAGSPEALLGFRATTIRVPHAMWRVGTSGLSPAACADAGTAFLAPAASHTTEQSHIVSTFAPETVGAPRASEWRYAPSMPSLGSTSNVRCRRERRVHPPAMHIPG
jgi:hypothetical protein